MSGHSIEANLLENFGVERHGMKELPLLNQDPKNNAQEFEKEPPDLKSDESFLVPFWQMSLRQNLTETYPF